MKICYLILAHNNFKHLDRMIEALNDENVVSFYIHVDKKAKESYIPTNKKATIIPDSYDIRWGGFSMVEATLSLLRSGIAGKDSDYYILLSGVDYPVRPKEYLANLLEQKKNYIDIAPMPVPYKPMERFEYYYFDYDRRKLKFYNPLFIAEVLMKKLKLKRKIPFELYVGSQWFALTHECVDYILTMVEEDKSYVDFFRHSLVPDEAFFQTIIGNSPFRDNTATNLTYTDWNVPTPPAVISERHIEFLKKNDKFETEYGSCHPYFARKFDDNSGAIISEIEKSLRQ